MKATVFYAPGDLRVVQVPDPKILEPTDAIVRVTHACICGSDLWYYRGLTPFRPGWRLGHEFMGIVEEVGPEVHTLRKGDRVWRRSLSPTELANSAKKDCRPRAFAAGFGA